MRAAFTLALLITGQGGLANAQKVTLPTAQSRCEEVTFAAEIGSCDGGTCELSGDVLLTCDALTLWADHLVVRRTEDGAFAGATANGRALLVDGRTVITCDTIELGPDRIRGRVTGAQLVIKEGRATDAQGVPVGRNRAVLSGDLERPDADHLLVYEGRFTLCDCPGGDPPPWELWAKEIQVELGERATLWWPILAISPFGLGPIPITPPGPPISIPLTDRAWGFLPPNLTFYGPFPMFDVPFFLPLGDTFDLTVSAGLRTDWVRNHGIQPSRWGAPRAGGRLRFAPTEGYRVEIDAQWTWDRRLYLANTYWRENDNTAVLEQLGRERESLPPQERGTVDAAIDRELRRRVAGAREMKRLRELEHRITINAQQTLVLEPGLRWLTRAEWLSDDAIRRDFGLTVSEQIIDYIPSRSLLTFAPPDTPVPFMALLGVDYLQRIGNDPNTYRNDRGRELWGNHRGPVVRLLLLPTAPFPEHLESVAVEGELATARVGPWDLGRPHELWVGASHLGLSFARALGPVSTLARARWHALVADALSPNQAGELLGRGATLLTFPQLSARTELTWAGGWTDTLAHSITPSLELQSIPGVWTNDAVALATTLVDSADERLQVEVLHQAALGLDQAWWVAGRRVAALGVQVPFDLHHPALLPLRISAEATLPYVGRGSAWTAVDIRDEDEPVQELGVSWTIPLRSLSLGASYLRLRPQSERFARSIYAIASAEISPDLPGDWVHAVIPNVVVSGFGAQLRYRAIVLLEQPDAPTLAAPPGSPRRPFVSQHQFGASYVSPCNCWDLSVNAQLPGTGTSQEIGQGLRLMVQFSIGGYRVGSRP